ncbi:MAG TPA: hypothetical protein VMR25_03740 [Planctomycetaceae bacterium]|jgi:hypothetical protein|nr:hypothetical protein [Planctomycetaceae bacterium]
MIATQTAIGAAVVGLCLFGMWQYRWLLENSRYGRRLVNVFGEIGGRRALFVLLAAGIVFGILLAADIIRPIQWTKR